MCVEPVDLSGLGEFVAIDAGWMHTLALKADGTVWAWGGNRYGQLGDGTAVDSPCPVQVTGLQEVKAIAAGGVFSMALKRDGTVWAWGDNYTRECGICETTQVPVVEPVQIEELSDVIAIDAGVQHGVALKPDGTVWCWGLGLFGILGQGAGDTYTSSCVPLKIVNLSSVTAIAAGADHTLALLSDGTVKGWGQGNCGQLGFGGAISTSDPATAYGMTEVVAIATGVRPLPGPAVRRHGLGLRRQRRGPAWRGLAHAKPASRHDPGVRGGHGHRRWPGRGPEFRAN